jgi:DnaJ-class molecular chaperone
MGSIHNHYDNLKVARDAPPEVIKAAYRALSQKHHPDRAPGPDAHRIMSIINTSYAVLIDPERRRAHDLWLAEQARGKPAPGAASPGRIDPETVDEAARKAGEPGDSMWSVFLARVILAMLMAMTSALFDGTRATPPQPVPAPQTAVAHDAAGR